MISIRSLSTRLFLCFLVSVGCVFMLTANVANAEELAETAEVVEGVTETAEATEVEAAEDEESTEEVEDTEEVESTEEAETAEDVESTEEVEPVEPVANEKERFSDLEGDQADIDRMKDVDLLGRLIQVEGGRRFEDKVCVALTVLHRVDSPDFPDTVEENISSPLQYAEPVEGDPNIECLVAAEFAMKLWESGSSYTLLPSQFLYFIGDGKDNSFHDSHGHYHELPEIEMSYVLPYIKGTQEWVPVFYFLTTFLVTSNFSI